MNTQAYFDRIGFEGAPKADLQTLQQLHRLHPMAICFENLDAWLRGVVSIRSENVFEKLVNQGRGGYCFEHNRLFADVLRSLGFQVSEHAARVVWRSSDKTRMARTHMLLKVSLDQEQWIADVGFGGITMTSPVKLETGKVQDSPHEQFRIGQDGNEFTISVLLNGAWKAMYVFDTVPQYPVDYEMANHFVSSHPESLFTSNLMLGRADERERHAVQNHTYTRYTVEGDKEQREIASAEELLDLLENTFRLSIGSGIDGPLLAEKFANLS